MTRDERSRVERVVRTPVAKGRWPRFVVVLVGVAAGVISAAGDARGGGAQEGSFGADQLWRSEVSRPCSDALQSMTPALAMQNSAPRERRKDPHRERTARWRPPFLRSLTAYELDGRQLTIQQVLSPGVARDWGGREIRIDVATFEMARNLAQNLPINEKYGLSFARAGVPQAEGEEGLAPYICDKEYSALFGTQVGWTVFRRRYDGGYTATYRIDWNPDSGAHFNVAYYRDGWRFYSVAIGFLCDGVPCTVEQVERLARQLGG